MEPTGCAVAVTLRVEVDDRESLIKRWMRNVFCNEDAVDTDLKVTRNFRVLTYLWFIIRRFYTRTDMIQHIELRSCLHVGLRDVTYTRWGAALLMNEHQTRRCDCTGENHLISFSRSHFFNTLHYAHICFKFGHIQIEAVPSMNTTRSVRHKHTHTHMF